MKARNRPHLITVERFTSTRNAYNEVVETWAPYCQEYAAVYFGRGSEQREAAQTTASQAASFEILSNSKTRAISVTDRISFSGSLWDIKSVAPIGLNQGVKLNAVRVAS